MNGLHLYDSDTGEVGERLVLLDPARANRAKQAVRIGAFCRLSQERGDHLAFWTFGTNIHVTVAGGPQLVGCWAAIMTGGERLPGRRAFVPGLEPLPGRWVAVLEAGEKSGYLHLHVITAGERLEVTELRPRWHRVCGIRHAHVDVQPVYTAEALGRYVRKLGSYVRKSGEFVEEFRGVRTLRSTKGLMTEVQRYLDAERGERPVSQCYAAIPEVR